MPLLPSACVVRSERERAGVCVCVGWGDCTEACCGPALRAALRAFFAAAPRAYATVAVDVTEDPYEVEFRATRARTSRAALHWLHARVCGLVRDLLRRHDRVTVGAVERGRRLVADFYVGTTEGVVARRAVRRADRRADWRAPRHSAPARARRPASPSPLSRSADEDC